MRHTHDAPQMQVAAVQTQQEQLRCAHELLASCSAPVLRAAASAHTHLDKLGQSLERVFAEHAEAASTADSEATNAQDKDWM